MSVAKRLKREYYAEKEARERQEALIEHQTQQALEEIDTCQNQIDLLNEKASEDILNVEQKYNKLRKPLFERRNGIIQKIENFWITAFVNHPQITALLDEDEEDCLHNLSKVEVEEFDDIKFGYRIKFYFEPNKYFENDVLTKEFFLGSPVPCSKSTTINWKEGQNIIQQIKARNEKNKKKQKRGDNKTFFTWYEDDCDPTADEIAEVIKDDLWPNPLQYYLSPDVEVDANGIEDNTADNDGGGEEDGPSDGDESFVIMLDEEDEDLPDEDCDQEPPRSPSQADEAGDWEVTATSTTSTTSRPPEERNE